MMQANEPADRGADSLTPGQVAIIIPTYNAARYWDALSAGIRAQSFMPERVIVIDSSSVDGTAEFARRDGFDRCRDLAERLQSWRYTADGRGAGRRRGHIGLPDAGCSSVWGRCVSKTCCARLTTRRLGRRMGANFRGKMPSPIEAHSRHFSYPAASGVRSWESRQSTGFKSIFFSNAFGAYRRSALMSVGGFSPDVIFGEDTLVVARMHRAGWKTAYVANAIVRHSHGYTIAEEFRRYFDVGVLHARENWLVDQFGSASGEGRRFVVSEMKHLMKKHPHLVPSAVARTFAKYLGYKIGRRERRIAPGLKYHLGLNRQYWSR